MKCKLLYTMEAGPTAPDEICFTENGRRMIKEGTVIEHPDAYKLAHGGHAECADKECEDRVASMNPDQRGALRKVHDRIMKEQLDFIDELEDEDEDEDELEDE